MNKFFIVFLSLMLTISIKSENNKFLSSNQEILVTSQLNDIYGTGMQQELVSITDIS